MIQRGFCNTKDQAGHLREYGIPAKDIWFAGRGAESLDGCLATFRGRSGMRMARIAIRVADATRK